MPPSTESLAGALLAAIDVELPAAIALRRRIHAAPELAHAEHATAASVTDALGGACTPVAGTGVLHRVGGPGAGVVVRAELDALPIAERTGAPFAATGAAMHACGHDVHAAALVALARAGARIADRLPAPLLALFQPSEEAFPSGAAMLMRERALAGQARAIVAAHVHPTVRWGAATADAGPVNASSDTLEIEVTGMEGHGAYPHVSADPVLALAQAVVVLHTLVARRIDPMRAAILSVGQLHAGSAENVIPARARARATLRALHPDDRTTLHDAVCASVEAVAAAHGCVGAVRIVAGEPVLDNDAEIASRLAELLPSAGLDVAPPMRSCGSDDFACFGELGPIAMTFVGLAGAPGFTPRPLHHAEFLPPDAAVAAVARAQGLAYLAAASPTSIDVRT